ncbi:hypothetical protein B0H17DRAFT_1303414 [Mycena rosella]|uniref:Copper homeostasis protein cutC homolog n=1 Tax=Mycena rosella TaxID=1033263 RepID=A0AAD7DA92_MYCRO|nr:hypothetical protein B0H17DRAFT_1303414 [Mycena rosella]
MSFDVHVVQYNTPSTGDFLYSDHEIEVMLEDIRFFKRRGVQGVVFGALKADERINIRVIKRLIDEALSL